MNPEIVKSWRGNTIIMTASGQMDHRATAIRAVCDLEIELSELLSAAFISLNPGVSHEKAKRELYAEGCALGSLRKMVSVAFFLGLVDEEQRFDLKTLAKLRDCYAHQRDAKQLYDDPALFALVTKTNLYKKNLQQLAGLDEQAVLMCIKAQLIFDLRERLGTL